MTGLNPLTIFGAGIENGFANVIFVGGHGASVFQLHGLAENSLQVRTAALRVGAMAGDATEFGENFFAGHGERAGCAAAHPGFELCGFHDHDGANHAGMLRAAVLRAEQVVGPGSGRVEPGDCVTAGKYVLLHAERGDEEAVDRILRSHDELHVSADWDVQFVDFALALGVFQLPHPLFGYDIHFGRVTRRRAAFEVHCRAPGEDRHEHKERNDRPGQFERG